MKMRQSGHICDSTKLFLLEIPGYELTESPYSVTDMLAEVGVGEGDPFRMIQQLRHILSEVLNLQLKLSLCEQFVLCSVFVSSVLSPPYARM